MLREAPEAEAKAERFANEDIDQILSSRTEKRQIGSRAGNTFSVASFNVDEAAAHTKDKNGRDFWAEILPEAVQVRPAALWRCLASTCACSECCRVRCAL